MRVLYGLFFVIVILFASSFALKNSQDVSIFYYFGIQWHGPLFAILGITLVIGLLLGAITMVPYSIKYRSQAGKAKRELAKIEKEVENLRKLPITEEV